MSAASLSSINQANPVISVSSPVKKEEDKEKKDNLVLTTLKNDEFEKNDNPITGTKLALAVPATCGVWAVTKGLNSANTKIFNSIGSVLGNLCKQPFNALSWIAENTVGNIPKIGNIVNVPYIVPIVAATGTFCLALSPDGTIKTIKNIASPVWNGVKGCANYVGDVTKYSYHRLFNKDLPEEDFQETESEELNQNQTVTTQFPQKEETIKKAPKTEDEKLKEALDSLLKGK